jgi:hypothetical protein
LGKYRLIINRPSAKSLKKDEEFRAKLIKPIVLLHKFAVLHACQCCYCFTLFKYREEELKYSFLWLNSGLVYDFPEPITEIRSNLGSRPTGIPVLIMQREQSKNLHTKFDINSEIQLVFSGPHAPHALL